MPEGGSFARPVWQVDGLPSVFKDAVTEVAGYTQAPNEMVSFEALSFGSLAFQHLYNVKGKILKDTSKGPEEAVAFGINTPLSLYCLTIAESGERKTTVESLFLPPFLEYQREQKKVADAEFRLWEHRVGIEKEKIKVLKEAFNKGDEKKFGAELSESVLYEKIKSIEIDMPEEPLRPHPVHSDATVESLTNIICKKWPSTSVITSEGGVFFGGYSMRPEAIAKTLGAYNDLWDGKGINKSTITGGEISTENTRLTLSVQVQPGMFTDFIKKSGASFEDSGALARFLMTIPESAMGGRTSDKVMPLEGKLGVLLNHMRIGINTPGNVTRAGGVVPKFLELSHDANVWLTDRYNEWERKLSAASANNWRFMSGSVSKAHVNICRVAGVLHCLGGRSIEDKISLETIKAAGHIVTNTLLPLAGLKEARQADAPLIILRRLASLYVKEVGGNGIALPVTLRAIKRKCVDVERLGDDAILAALDELQDLNWLTIQDSQRRGKGTSIKVVLSPLGWWHELAGKGAKS
jgi:putative DNA primase/helicase